MVHRAPLALICSAAVVLAPWAAATAAAADESASAPITVDLRAATGVRSIATAVEPSTDGYGIRVTVDELARNDGGHWWVTATMGAATSTVIDGWGRPGVLSTRHLTAAGHLGAASGTLVVTLFD
jgi:hypothetical protein